jgi:8-oxo-dGTP pyrophosphatase MutT (NUDIX family)
MQDQEAVIELLEQYTPEDHGEIKAKKFIVHFLKTHKRFWSRETLEGHLTASAWITDETCSQAVLLHHKKLNMWVQPGGHIDEGDASVPAASFREASEETGLKNLVPYSAGIFDIDMHRIPARKDVPEHWHLDLRFWFLCPDSQLIVSDESHDLAWLSREEIEQKTDEESVLRMVRKTMIA